MTAGATTGSPGAETRGPTRGCADITNSVTVLPQRVMLQESAGSRVERCVILMLRCGLLSPCTGAGSGLRGRGSRRLYRAKSPRACGARLHPSLWSIGRRRRLPKNVACASVPLPRVRNALTARAAWCVSPQAQRGGKQPQKNGGRGGVSATRDGQRPGASRLSRLAAAPAAPPGPGRRHLGAEARRTGAANPARRNFRM